MRIKRLTFELFKMQMLIILSKQIYHWLTSSYPQQTRFYIISTDINMHYFS